MHIKRSRVSTKAGKKEYLSLVESYREQGKKKHRVIATLGRADTLDEERIQKMVYGLSRLTKNLKIMKHKTGDPDVQIHESKNLGVPLVIEYFWKELGMPGLFKKIQAKYPKICFDIELICKFGVLHRLVKPGSERSMIDWKQDVYLPGIEKIELQHLYRGLKIISDHQSEIEDHLFAKAKDLFGLDCSLVFFDTTSTYFEGDALDNEALKQYGHSKDHRPDRKQIKVGMVMSRDGIPIHLPFFAGNESDTAVVPEVLKTLRERMKIGNVVFVGDSGMMSKENVKEIQESQMQYILGARLRNSKVIKEKILSDIDDLKNPEKRSSYEVKQNLFVLEKTAEGKRYILCYNPEEAKRDKAVREEILQRLQSEINTSPKKYMRHKLYKRFLNITEVKATLDMQKVKEEEQYDGVFVIETDTDFSPEEVALRYKDLLLVERSFRYLKSTLDVRPIYHKTSENIQGHIFVSFLALHFFCLMLKKLEQSGKPIPCEEEQIIASLSRIMAHRTTIHGETFFLRSELNPVNSALLASLSIQIPSQVLKKW